MDSNDRPPLQPGIIGSAADEEAGDCSVEEFLCMINGSQAREVLRIIAGNDPGTARLVRETIELYLAENDAESIAREVYFNLEHIDVEEVLKRTGNIRMGIAGLYEVAWKQFEAVLDPYMVNMKMYQKRLMNREACEQCRGMLMGIRRFEKESTSRYRELAEDVPGHYAKLVFKEWKKGSSSPEDVQKLERLLK